MERHRRRSDLRQRGTARPSVAGSRDSPGLRLRLDLRDPQGDQPGLAAEDRYRGHSAADPEIYRDKKEVEEWQEKDPIEAFIRVCVEGGRLEDGDVEEIRAEADKTVVEAVEFADASPEPPLETLYDGLYVVGETMGWYAVDERSPEPHRGEYGEDAPDIAKELAESGAEHPSDQERQDRPGVRG